MVGKDFRKSGFGKTVEYVVKKCEGDPILKMELGPYNDPDRLAMEMESVAGQSTAKQPCFHLIISWDPSDRVGREAMEYVARRLVKDLGLEGHQVLAVEHADTSHPHMHIVANRVHRNHGEPKEFYVDAPPSFDFHDRALEIGGEYNKKKKEWVFTYNKKDDVEKLLNDMWQDDAPKLRFGKERGVWKGWKCRNIYQETLREMERKFGWRQVEGTLSNQVGHLMPERTGETRESYHRRKKTGEPRKTRSRKPEDVQDRLFFGAPSGPVPRWLPRTKRALLACWRAAIRGDADSQYKMGKMFEMGAGVPNDMGVAMGWFQLAALQGHPVAQAEFRDGQGDGYTPRMPTLPTGEDERKYVCRGGEGFGRKPKNWIGEWIGDWAGGPEIE